MFQETVFVDQLTLFGGQPDQYRFVLRETVVFGRRPSCGCNLMPSLISGASFPSLLSLGRRGGPPKTAGPQRKWVPYFDGTMRRPVARPEARGSLCVCRPVRSMPAQTLNWDPSWEVIWNPCMAKISASITARTAAVDPDFGSAINISPACQAANRRSDRGRIRRGCAAEWPHTTHPGGSP